MHVEELDEATRRHKPSPSPDPSQRPQDWSRAQRLAVLIATGHGLDEQALSTLCRECGISRQHLHPWQAEFEAVSAQDEWAALRDLK